MVPCQGGSDLEGHCDLDGLSDMPPIVIRRLVGAPACSKHDQISDEHNQISDGSAIEEGSAKASIEEGSAKLSIAFHCCWQARSDLEGLARVEGLGLRSRKCVNLQGETG